MSAAPLRSILYVDDEPDIREIVKIALGLTQSGARNQLRQKSSTVF
jgi:hypothetical protein